jgi:hypothetical protein
MLQCVLGYNISIVKNYILLRTFKICTTNSFCGCALLTSVFNLGVMNNFHSAHRLLWHEIWLFLLLIFFQTRNHRISRCWSCSVYDLWVYLSAGSITITFKGCAWLIIPYGCWAICDLVLAHLPQVLYSVCDSFLNFLCIGRIHPLQERSWCWMIQSCTLTRLLRSLVVLWCQIWCQLLVVKGIIGWDKIPRDWRLINLIHTFKRKRCCWLWLYLSNICYVSSSDYDIFCQIVSLSVWISLWRCCSWSVRQKIFSIILLEYRCLLIW